MLQGQGWRFHRVWSTDRFHRRQAEGPIHRDLVARRVAEAFGKGRTGKRIRDASDLVRNKGEQIQMNRFPDDQTDLLMRLAGRYIWWLSPDESIKTPSRILLQVMEIGNWEDCLAMMNAFPRDRLIETLKEGTAGTLSPKSWNFWHLRLGVGERGNPPPLPPARRVA